MKQKSLIFLLMNIITALIWFAVGVCLVFFGFKIFSNSDTMVYADMVEQQLPVVTEVELLQLLDTEKLLLADAEVIDEPVDDRFKLAGVIAGETAYSAALIAVDSAQEQPFRVGDVVDGDYVLKAVSKNKAVLALTTIDAADALVLRIREDEVVKKFLRQLQPVPQ